MSKYLLSGLGMLVGLSLSLGVGWFWLGRSYTYQGVLIDPPAAAADIQLKDQNGDIFRLSDQRGKVVLIFFGYTHCPDVCPLTLYQYQQIKAQLGDKASQVRFVFVTVDPLRDTPEAMRAYLAKFDPSFTGLSGDPNALEPVWKSYGVYAATVTTASNLDALIDHSARVYLIDPQGNWRLDYPYGIATQAFVNDILHLLRFG
jgi:protein SCO1